MLPLLLRDKQYFLGNEELFFLYLTASIGHDPALFFMCKSVEKTCLYKKKKRKQKGKAQAVILFCTFVNVHENIVDVTSVVVKSAPLTEAH